jgi:hypothetical protein
MIEPIVIDSPQRIELALHSGGGASLTITEQDGSERIIDIFPTVEGASERDQLFLDAIGRALTVRIEDQGSRSPEIAPRDLNDITDAPTPQAIPWPVRTADVEVV